MPIGLTLCVAGRLADDLSGDSYERGGDELRDAGLYVDLGPWQYHLLEARVL